jgi:hypothetical protein
MHNGKKCCQSFVKIRREQFRVKEHYAEEWRILNDRLSGVRCAVSARNITVTLGHVEQRYGTHNRHNSDRYRTGIRRTVDRPRVVEFQIYRSEPFEHFWEETGR